MIDRRRLILTAAAGSAFAGLPVSALAQTTPAGEDARLDALLTRQMEAGFDRAPESVTGLGIDVGARAAQRHRLNSRSIASAAEGRALAQRQLAELQAIDVGALSPEARLTHDIFMVQRTNTAAYEAFPWHTSQSWRLTPYLVSQLGGAYAEVPSFLDTTHPVKTVDDAEAFVSRLAAFAVVIDEETERTRANAGMGVVAPDFVLDKAIRQLAALRDQPGTEQAMIQSLSRRMAGNGIVGDHVARSLALFEGEVRPALDRQIAELRKLREGAVHEAGVRRLPDGEAYYAQNLKTYTTTDYSPQDIHAIGLEQVGDLTGRIEALLRPQGMTQGTIGERLKALRADPRHLFANDDAGREELLAFINAEMAEIRARMPEAFARIPKIDFVIRRVPPAIESGAPGGYAQSGSLDGTRPGIYFINLRDTAEWPRWTLKTLTYHEAAPGHLFEGGLALEAGELPLYRRLTSFGAYGEGWGLYSERLADELGVYDDDPLGRIGYLESFLFRAARLVVDTGLHSQGWSRERAIAYMAETLGDPNEAEIERYCVAPGQACSYKLGEIVISRLRDAAETRPGFDLKRFHSVVLDAGRVPLTVLERRVQAAFPA
jgi:uncharacterized protein (DUF885 family)